MPNTIITKNSATASAVPSAASLVQGELAVNVTDKKLYTKNASGTVVEIGGGGAAQVGDVVFGASAPASGTWLETGKYYSKATYPALASNLGNVPDGGNLPATNSVNIPSIASYSPSGTTMFRNVVASNSTNTAYVALGGSALWYSADGTNFRVVPSQQGQSLKVVKFLNGRFFALSNTVLISSVDGITWVPVFYGMNNMVDIAFGAGVYVVAMLGGRMAYSTDANTWTTVYIGASLTPTYIIYANGCFIATYPSAAYRSTDGITWTQVYASGAYAIIWDGTRFIMSTSGTDIVWSTTGASGTWTSVAVGANVVDLTTNGSVWIAATFTTLYYSSNPTVSWTASNGAVTGVTGGSVGRLITYYYVTYDSVNNRFIASGNRARYYVSTDGGVNWTANALTNVSQNTVCFAGNRTFLLSDTQINRVEASGSPTLLQVTNSGMCSYPSTPGVRAPIETVAYGNGVFCAIAPNTTGIGSGTVWRSTDGINWTAVVTRDTITLYPDRVYFVNGTFVAIGTSGGTSALLYYSTDALTWSSAAVSGLTSNMGCVAYGNSTWVVAGASGGLASGSSLTSLTSRSVGTQVFMDMIFANGRFVAATTTSIMQSTDGITWTTPLASGYWNRVIYENSRFVAVGLSGTGAVATSTDGLSWTVQNSLGSQTFNDVAYNGTRFVAVANSTTIIYSTDGTASSWLFPSSVQGYSDTGASLNIVKVVGTTFYAVATNNFQYYRSTDGITWSRSRTASNTGYFAPISKVSTGRLFIQNYYGLQTSTDGQTWKPANICQFPASSGFFRVYRFGSYYYGLDSSTGVYISSDGVTFSNIPELMNSNPIAMASSGTTVAVFTQGSSTRGYGIYTSTDGVNFALASTLAATLFTTSFTGTGIDMVYANGRFVISFNQVFPAQFLYDPVYTSSDCVTWTPAQYPIQATPQTLFLMATDGTTILMPTSSNVLRSTDGGQTWTSLLTGWAGNSPIVFVDGVWVISGIYGTFISTDTTNWTCVSEQANPPRIGWAKTGNYLVGVGPFTITVIDVRNGAYCLSPVRDSNGTNSLSNAASYSQIVPVRGGTTMLFPTALTSAFMVQSIVEVPLYSYDTATTFWVPPFNGGAGQKAYICAAV